MFRYFLLLIVMLGFNANAHEWTPTYPNLEPSYVDGVMVAKMKLFNKREDVEFYEIQVVDANWNPLPFVSTERVVRMKFLETKNIDVFIREKDRQQVKYICTSSKLLKMEKTQTVVASRICSKIK